MKFDYLIVGAGLFGSVFVHEMKKKGKKCLVVERRGHIGGNIYTEKKEGIDVHQYGAHIFHTSEKKAWDYIRQFTEFNHYVNSPVAIYKDRLYNLPFNMNTFYGLWGVRTPEEAKQKLKEQTAEYAELEPKNLEEQALSLVGKDIYEALIKGYTEKQWGRKCRELPAFIIKRLPLRFTFDNNYFNDSYQGIPINGYTEIIEKLLEGTEVKINTEYKEIRDKVKYDKVIYTGMIDEYFDYCLGNLDYRSLRFEHEFLESCENYQGNAVVNYTEREIPYTRIIEHKHFVFGKQKDTVITREYPAEWKKGDEPYYPVNDEKNNLLYKKYEELAKREKRLLFGGRLGQYRYYDMDKTVLAALDLAERQ